MRCHSRLVVSILAIYFTAYSLHNLSSDIDRNALCHKFLYPSWSYTLINSSNRSKVYTSCAGHGWLNGLSRTRTSSVQLPTLGNPNRRKLAQENIWFAQLPATKNVVGRFIKYKHTWLAEVITSRNLIDWILERRRVTGWIRISRNLIVWTRRPKMC
jgi:hypothetical protein